MCVFKINKENNHFGKRVTSKLNWLMVFSSLSAISIKNISKKTAGLTKISKKISVCFIMSGQGCVLTTCSQECIVCAYETMGLYVYPASTIPLRPSGTVPRRRAGGRRAAVCFAAAAGVVAFLSVVSESVFSVRAMGNNESIEEPFTRAQPAEAGRMVFLLWLAHRYMSNVLDAAKGGATLDRKRRNGKKKKRRSSVGSYDSDDDDNTSRFVLFWS